MKRLLVAFLLSLTSLSCAAGTTSILSIKDFKGMQDVYSADKMNPAYATDCQNVILDEYRGSLIKRRGYVKYNTSAVTGGQAITKLYTYKQQDGDEYIIAQSSNSLFHSLNGCGAFTILTSTITTSVYTFTTGKDLLIGCNGVDTVITWNGTNINHYDAPRSTGMVSGKYVCYFNNRLFIAGVSAFKSTLYYSEYNDPANIGTFNFMNINVADGDYITGLKAYGGKLYVTKRYSTWEVQEVSAGVFDFKPISQEIGCLYGQSMAEVKGFPVWISHRGVEMYDGNFNLISAPIDNQIKELTQLASGSGSMSFDSYDDFNTGIFDNTQNNADGYVDMKSVNPNTIYALGYSTSGYAGRGLTSGRLWQKISVPYDFILSTISVYGYGTNDGYDDSIYLTIYKSTGIITSGLTNYGAFGEQSIGTSDTVIVSTELQTTAFKFSNIPLYKNATYYFDIGQATSGTGYNIALSTAYTGGEYVQANTYSSSVNWTVYSSSDIMFAVYGNTITTSSYSTAVSTATGWTSWGTFTKDDVVDSSSTVNYYILSSTATNNFASKTPQKLNNGDTITSTAGNYFMIVASFTRAGTVNPKINRMGITWATNSDIPVIGQEYKDRYYFGCITDNSAYNNTVYVYDKDENWIRYTGINLGASCLYKNKFYFGDSSSTGYVYLFDVANLFSDDGAAFSSYWQSKVFNADTSINEKLFTDEWIIAENMPTSPTTMYLDYRLDGESSAWNTVSLDLAQSWGYRVQRIPLAFATKGYFIQFRIRSTDTNKLHLKELHNVFEVLTPR